MTIYPALALIFFVAGLALLLTLAYLTYLTKQHRRSLCALLKLSKTGLDPLQIPAAAWPILAQDGIKQLDYSGYWFGQPVQGSFTTVQDTNLTHPFIFKICFNQDIRLDFRLYARTDRGEARQFAGNLSDVFRLLLETAIRGKMESLSTSLSEQARLTLYLQHDLRNLAQWVEWLATDFSGAQDNDELLTIARRLNTSAPHAATRARRILNASRTRHTHNPPEQELVLLSKIIRQTAEHAGIQTVIQTNSHNPRVYLRRDLLERTLDNLFANVAPLLRLHPDKTLSIEITGVEKQTQITIKMPQLAYMAQLPPEKLFEPFSSGRPGGLGLGLYQARKSLMEAGGNLAAKVDKSHICFLLNLPVAGINHPVPPLTEAEAIRV